MRYWLDEELLRSDVSVNAGWCTVYELVKYACARLGQPKSEMQVSAGECTLGERVSMPAPD